MLRNANASIFGPLFQSRVGTEMPRVTVAEKGAAAGGAALPRDLSNPVGLAVGGRPGLYPEGLR
jgi:hypothetical protein